MKNKKSYILETCFRLFLRKSFKEVTMKEIVKETGISKGAFYHYFPTKEHLFNEMVDTYYLTFFSIDYTLFNQENLQAFYTEYLDYIKAGITELLEGLGLDRDTEAVNYYLMIFDAIKLYPGFRDKTIKQTEKEMESWTKVVAHARQRREIDSPMTDGQIAKIFTRTNDGIGIHMILTGNIEAMTLEIKEIWDGFYREIKT